MNNILNTKVYAKHMSKKHFFDIQVRDQGVEHNFYFVLMLLCCGWMQIPN